MKTTLDLGPDVVQRLLPHRRPLLLVDRVEAYDDEKFTLWAARLISSNEPVFDGHFPGLHLWPGVYTIEGLLQSTNLLDIVRVSMDALKAEGREPLELLEALKNLELGYRMGAGYRHELTERFRALLGQEPDAINRGGMAASIDVKLLAPVFAGSRLDYRVTFTREVEQLQRYEVEASVNGRTVAKGVVTNARGAVRAPVVLPR